MPIDLANRLQQAWDAFKGKNPSVSATSSPKTSSVSLRDFFLPVIGLCAVLLAEGVTLFITEQDVVKIVVGGKDLSLNTSSLQALGQAKVDADKKIESATTRVKEKLFGFHFHLKAAINITWLAAELSVV